ncbi:MAG: HMG-box domain-containing protein [Thermofilaceae archaeon]
MSEEGPRSALSQRVKRVLVEAIEEESKKALEEGDDDYLVELQRAKRLILRGAWKVRRANPYLAFMEECMVSSRPREGRLTLEEVQRLFKECAAKWRQLPEPEKDKYRALAGELAVYDYS